MTAGLKIINAAGTILIDDKYPVLVLLEKGSVSIDASGYASLGNRGGSIALSSTSPVSTVVFEDNPALDQGKYVVGPVGARVQWYRFGYLQQSTSTFGLVVKNAQDQVMFDAAALPARVVAVRSGTAVESWSGSINMPAGRTYVALPLKNAFASTVQFTRVVDSASGREEYAKKLQISLSAAAVSGNTVSFSMLPPVSNTKVYTGTAPANYTLNSGNAAFAVLDVTGY